MNCSSVPRFVEPVGMTRSPYQRYMRLWLRGQSVLWPTGLGLDSAENVYPSENGARGTPWSRSLIPSS